MAAAVVAGAHSTAPSQADEVLAQLRRLEHLGVLEEREHEGPERVAVRHRELDDDRTVVTRLDDVIGPTCCTADWACGPSIRTRAVTGSSPPSSQAPRA